MSKFSTIPRSSFVPQEEAHLDFRLQTRFTDISLCRILALTPLLEQLDISNTSCYEPSLWLHFIAPHQLISFKWSDIDASTISRVQQNALSQIRLENLSLHHAWQLRSLDLSNNPLVNTYLKSGPDLGSMTVLSLTSLTLTGLQNPEAQCLSAVLANCYRTLTVRLFSGTHIDEIYSPALFRSSIYLLVLCRPAQCLLFPNYAGLHCVSSI